MIKNGKQGILAFDVGGSHIGAGVFSPRSMVLELPDSILVSNAATPNEIFGAFRKLAHSLLNDLSCALVGVAVSLPSPFDYAKGISYMEHKYRQLYGVNVRLELAECLGCDPEIIHLLNDAAAFLIGELTQGLAARAKRAVGITLGTGVGSAFAVDGAIVTKGVGIPPQGEIWNLPYGNATVEDAASTRAIQRLYEQRTGLRADVREIARQSSQQANAREAFAAFGTELGRVLRLTCAPFVPDRIVLGGGISRAASLFLSRAEAELDDLAVTLCVSELMDRAPLIGAAVSWMETYAPEQLLQARVQSIPEGRVEV